MKSDVKDILRAIINSLPPSGGSGLKYMVVCQNDVHASGLPPSGGSGLKLNSSGKCAYISTRSPSVRREWIEIQVEAAVKEFTFVSLRPEGVD